MRTVKRLLRGIAATVLGLSLAMSATAVPARAAADGPNYQAYLEFLSRALEMGHDGLTPAEANQLIHEIIGVLQGTKVDLLTRLNTELANEIHGSTEAAVNKAEMLKVMWLAGPAINSMHDAAYRAKAHLATVRDSDEALDVVGRAMIVLFNLLHAAYSGVDAEEGTHAAVDQLPQFRQGLEYLIQEMAPTCTPGGLPSAGMRSYTCEYGDTTVRAEWWAGTNTYTINNGDPIPGQIDESIIVEITMRDTVWQLARQTLAELVRAGVRLP